MEQKIHDLYITMLNNPQFQEFVKSNEGKSVEEIATEYKIIKGNNV